MKRIVIGIDPGTKVGLAIFDFDKNLICTKTLRGGLVEIVQEISKHGTPAIIASDRKSPPPLVRKVAACFGAKIYSPKKSLTVLEKARLTTQFKLTAHEKDAVAAALAFFAAYKNKFAWIERIAKEHAANADELKYWALIGVPIMKMLR